MARVLSSWSERRWVVIDFQGRSEVILARCPLNRHIKERTSENQSLVEFSGFGRVYPFHEIVFVRMPLCA